MKQKGASILAIIVMFTFAFGLAGVAGEVLNVANVLGWSVGVPLWKLAPHDLPHIQIVRYEYPFTDLFSKQMLELKLHTGAIDVLEVPEAWAGSIAPYVVPVGQFMRDDPEIDFEEYVNQLSAGTKAPFYDPYGDLMFLPFHGSTPFGAYRKDLFTDPKERQAFKEQYGMELPQPDEYGMIHFKDLDHFIKVAQFFTRDLDGDGKIDLWGYLVPGKWDHGANRFEDRLLRSGLRYFDEDGHCLWGPAHPENKQIVEAIAKFAQDLIYKYKVTPPDIVGWGTFETVSYYYEGKAAMIVTWLGDYWWNLWQPDVVEKIGEPGSFELDFLDYAFNPEPHEPGAWVASWAWGINADSDKPELAYEFIKWTVSEDTWMKRLEYARDHVAGVTLPPRRPIVEMAVEKGLVPKAMYETARHPQPFRFELPEFEMARDIIRKYHEQLLVGQITPEEFVEITGEEIEELMQK